MKQINPGNTSSIPMAILLSDRVHLRPVALCMAGFLLLTPISACIASVATAMTGPAPGADQNNQLATHLARAAGMIQSGSRQQADDYVTGLASSAASSAAGEWLNQFGTAQVNLGLDNNLRTRDSALDVLVPLYDSPQAMLFTQFGVRKKDERNTVNLGAGVRTFTSGNWMFGGNVFLDNDLTGKNRRAGLGGEAGTDYLKLSANHYFALTDWHQSRKIADYDERPSNGWDARAEGWLPSYAQLGGKLIYEKYQGREVALAGRDARQKNPSALTAGMNWTPLPLVTLGAEHRASSGGKQDSQVNMTMTVRPGVSADQHLNPSAVAAIRTLTRSRMDLVERNNNIVLDHRQQELMKLSLPATLSAPAATILTVEATVKAKYGLKEIDWHSPQLETDGGTLTAVSPDRLAVLLPARPRDLPYVLTGVARDARGHVSGRAVSYITVTAADAGAGADDSQTIHSVQKSITPSTLPADGQSTARITLSLMDADGRPVSGQAGEMKMNLTHTPAPVTMMAMSLIADVPEEPVVSAYSEVEPGMYEAMLKAGNVSGTILVATEWRGEVVGKASVTLTQVGADEQEDASLHSVIEITKNDAIANGVDKNYLRITLKDAAGNALKYQEIRLSTHILASLVEDIITDDNGMAEFDVTSKMAGTTVIQFLVRNNIYSAEVNFKPDFASATPVIKVTENHALADGTDQNLVQLQLRDSNGNVVPEEQIALAADNDASIQSQVNTGSNGQVTVPLVSTRAGVVNVTATYNSVTATATLEFIPSAGTAAISGAGVRVLRNDAQADGKDMNAVEVTVTDANDNPLQGLTVYFSADNGAQIIDSVITDQDGKAMATITSLHAGKARIEASVNGKTTTADINFKTVQADKVVIAMTPSAAKVKVGEKATMVVLAKDASNKPLANARIDIAVTSVQDRQNKTVSASKLLINGAELNTNSTFYTDATGQISLSVTDPLGNGVKRKLVATSGSASDWAEVIFTVITSPDTPLASMWGHMPDVLTAGGMTFHRPKLAAEIKGANIRAENNEIWGLYTQSQGMTLCQGRIPGTEGGLKSLYNQYPSGTLASKAGWPVDVEYRSSNLSVQQPGNFTRVNMKSYFLTIGSNDSAKYITCN